MVLAHRFYRFWTAFWKGATVPGGQPHINAIYLITAVGLVLGPLGLFLGLTQLTVAAVLLLMYLVYTVSAATLLRLNWPTRYRPGILLGVLFTVGGIFVSGIQVLAVLAAV
jgi:hypothetical protein